MGVLSSAVRSQNKVYGLALEDIWYNPEYMEAMIRCQEGSEHAQGQPGGDQENGVSECKGVPTDVASL